MILNIPNLNLFCFPVATEVVTVFVFQEPSLLSSLQDNGLTDVMLHALLIKDVSLPAHRVCAVVFYFSERSALSVCH